MKDYLSVNDLKELLDENIDIYHYDVIDSTSTEARRMLDNKDTFCDLSNEYIVVTDEQTAGRGRQGRTFVSEGDKGLYFTYVLPNKMNDGKTYENFTTLVAVAVADAINEDIFKSTKALVKWVNDIYVDDKKVCGILCEAYKDNILVGIGVNLYPFEVPENLINKVGFVLPNEPCKTKLLASIIRRIKYYALNQNLVIEKARELSYLTGKKINFFENNIYFEALVDGIEDDGALRTILSDNTIKLLRSGEISVSFN